MISFSQLMPKPMKASFTGEDLDILLWVLTPAGRELLPQAGIDIFQAECDAAGPALGTGSPANLFLRKGKGLGKEGYKLSSSARGVTLIAEQPAGFFYGIMTLCQWRRIHRLQRLSRLTGFKIEDRPQFANRGIMLDISRNKIPTLASLFELVDLFATLKINQLQLYTEHSFAYAGHEPVWADFSPITPAEMDQLRDYCADRFITLVPNQNSFGHFHRWLVHEPYRRLAECPEGIEHPFSKEIEPFSLCATDPGCLALLDDLYGQLLPHSDSPWLNVGLDETLELGEGRSKQACAEKGKTAVYLDYLKKVHQLVTKHGRRMMFWGDIIINQPQSLKELPEDVLVLEWGYEADHPFAEHGRAFAASGRPFYVCPGTSSWNSFSGRLSNALANLASAAKHGLANGAEGYLITDWGDRGHLQTLPISYPGFLAGAALAWNTEEPITLARIAEGLDLHVWGSLEATPTKALMQLGDTYRHGGACPTNGSALFFLWWFLEADLSHEQVRGLSLTGLAEIKDYLVVAESLAAGIDAGLFGQIKAELRWTIEMLRWCIQLGRHRLICGEKAPLSALAEPTKKALTVELERLLAARKPLWLKRNRPGGWQATAQLWQERIQTFWR